MGLLTLLGTVAPALLRFAGKENAAAVTERAAAAAQVLTGEAQPERAIDAIRANPELLARFQAMSNEIAIAEMEAETRRLEAQNATIRAEIQSSDPYVRRARPTFLYAIAITWSVQMVGFGAAVVLHPTEAPKILSALGDVAFMWAIALPVVGVYIKVRSDDKKTSSGMPAPSMLQSIAGMLGRGH